ncbi:hypothetical protein JAAARDRAFT_57398 [Jaapia argillacea MUCL 33604]|uniref:DUF6699 domain-containing protein n=1 Tax=Jaapia argillacea MUCL 33604 TaxID=933084 RepID=A0A067Q7A6_9AGAM|nr:hypothetical protein JAAARDRAFT_57398 [Jaapia argillacea MUCL 33604]
MNYRLSIHPLLQYSQLTGQPSLIQWDVRQPPATSVHDSPSGRHRGRLPTETLAAFATKPPTAQIIITCGILPYSHWTATAHNPRGVTVLDVLQSIYNSLRHPIRWEEWNGIGKSEQDRASAAFDVRWRNARDPGYERSRGVRRIDFLTHSFKFSGLSPSPHRPETLILTLSR